MAAINWRAIAAGVFVALALQTLLLVFGLALGSSVGDHTVESGYAWWSVAVQLIALATGGAIAAHVSQATSQLAGMIAGGMVWAVAIVLSGMLGGLPLARAATVQFGTSGTWAAFFGILLGLGAALIGGTMGARRGRHVATPPTTIQPASPGPV